MVISTHLKLWVAVARHNFIILIAVDLVIFACLNFREFSIFGLLTNFRIHKFSFFFSTAIIKIIVREILEFALANYAKIKTSDLLYFILRFKG